MNFAPILRILDAQSPAQQAPANVADTSWVAGTVSPIKPSSQPDGTFRTHRRDESDTRAGTLEHDNTGASPTKTEATLDSFRTHGDRQTSPTRDDKTRRHSRMTILSNGTARNRTMSDDRTASNGNRNTLLGKKQGPPQTFQTRVGSVTKRLSLLNVGRNSKAGIKSPISGVTE